MLLLIKDIIKDAPGLTNDILEQFIIALARDLDIKVGPTPRTNNSIGIAIIPGNNTLKLLATLRTGEVDPVPYIVSFCQGITSTNDNPQGRGDDGYINQ